MSMENETLEQLLSNKRLETYYKQFEGNKNKAIEYYQLNIKVSESFYPLLANLEVVLRNLIHKSFSVRFGSDFWFDNIIFKELSEQVNIAKSKIIKNKQMLTSDKIVAELTFGFWTSLFNKQYALLFWKPLTYVFKELNTNLKHRDKIAFRLNHIRKFRNRIFHYEPICNDLAALKINHTNIIDILNWLDKDLVVWSLGDEKFGLLYENAITLKQLKAP